MSMPEWQQTILNEYDAELEELKARDYQRRREAKEAAQKTLFRQLERLGVPTTEGFLQWETGEDSDDATPIFSLDGLRFTLKRTSNWGSYRDIHAALLVRCPICGRETRKLLDNTSGRNVLAEYIKGSTEFHLDHHGCGEWEGDLNYPSVGPEPEIRRAPTPAEKLVEALGEYIQSLKGDSE